MQMEEHVKIAGRAAEGDRDAERGANGVKRSSGIELESDAANERHKLMEEDPDTGV